MRFPKTPLAVFILLAVMALLQAGVRAKDEKRSAEALLTVRGTRIAAEVADTSTERIQGLSGRESLAENEGMLFVFPEPDFHGIWMKDMLFPLDIIWLDDIKRKPRTDADFTRTGAENKRLVIVGIQEGVAPETFPQVFYPKERAMYVLEVPAGFSKKKHLQIGDVLGIERP